MTARILMSWLLRLCHERGLYDAIAARRPHNNNIPRIGGAVFVPALMVGVSTTLLLRLWQEEVRTTIFLSTFLLACGVLVIYVVGLADDLTRISSRLKKIIKLLVAAIFPLAGLCINNLYGLFGLHELGTISSTILTFLLTLCIVEAYNSEDDTDGLAGSLAAIFLLILGAHFFLLGCFTYAFVAASLLGAVFVYLYYNLWGDCRIGTKVYMGNSGALILGYTICYLAFKYAMVNKHVMESHPDGLLVAFSLLLLPLYDFLRVLVTTLWQGRPKNEWKQWGLYQREVTLLMSLLCVAFYLINQILHSLLNLGLTQIAIFDTLLYTVIYLVARTRAKDTRTADQEQEKNAAPLCCPTENHECIPGLVSVIMPTWNSKRFVSESIQSVLNQTYKNLELIITDDASTDSTPDILRKWERKDPRIRVFYNRVNGGAGNSRNCSIRAARGQYIAFCDSDDRWVPEKLEQQIRFMEKLQVALCFSPYYTCDAQNHYLGYVSAPRRVSLFSMMCDNKIGFLTAIYDTRILGKHLMPQQRKRQDHALLLELLRHCHYAYSINEPLAHYRLHSANMSGSKMGLLKYNARTYNAVFGWPMSLSYVFLFTFFLPTYFWKRIRNIIINIWRTQLG